MKKRYHALLAVMLAALLLVACGKQPAVSEPESSMPEQSSSEQESSLPSEPEQPEVQPVTTLSVETSSYQTYHWDEELQEMTAMLKYSYPHVSGADKENYPALTKTLSELVDKRQKNLISEYEESVPDSVEHFTEFTEYAVMFELTEEVQVRRADTRVLSLLIDGYCYAGGVHGYPYYGGVNFDTQTGEILTLSDIFTDCGRLSELVEEQLYINYDPDCFFGDVDLDERFSADYDQVEWVLDYNGVTFYFNPYDIAPFASGILSATISFAEHPDLFCDTYCEVPDSYGIELPQEHSFSYDVDGDGKLDDLWIAPAEGNYGDGTPQSICLNGTWYEEDNGIFEIIPSLLHLADGRNYLYIAQLYPDDRYVYEVYDVSRGSVEPVDTIYAECHIIGSYQNDYYAREVLTNPEQFRLDTCTAVLGTAYGYDSYHVGENGMPVGENGYYTIDNGSYLYEFTLTQDLTVPVVDESGATVGETTLKKGDKVTYYRTDNVSWGDVLLADGRLGRVIPDMENDYTIDGRCVDEVFDGAFF